jgi:hypothetical protein
MHVIHREQRGPDGLRSIKPFGFSDGGKTTSCLVAAKEPLNASGRVGRVVEEEQ